MEGPSIDRFDASGPELERRNSGTTLRFIIPLPVSLHPMAQKTHFAILPSTEGGAKKGMIRLVIVEDEPEMPAARLTFAPRLQITLLETIHHP